MAEITNNGATRCWQSRKEQLSDIATELETIALER
jgi:hypothetical protein